MASKYDCCPRCGECKALIEVTSNVAHAVNELDLSELDQALAGVREALAAWKKASDEFLAYQHAEEPDDSGYNRDPDREDFHSDG